MFGRFAPGPRPAAFLIAFLIALGVVAAGPAGGASGEAELVRVVVEFDDPPLAKYRDTLPGLKGVKAAKTDKGHVDVEAPASRAYLAHLGKKHKDFEELLRTAAPDVAVQWHYDTAFNGVAIEVPRDLIDRIRSLPDVASVTETYELEPELDESRSLLGLQTLWQSLPLDTARGRRGHARRADRLGRERAAPVLQRGRLHCAGGLPEGAARGRRRAHRPPARDVREQQGHRRQRLPLPGQHDGDAVGAGLAPRHARRRDHGRQQRDLRLHVRPGHVPAAVLGHGAGRVRHELPPRR